MIEKKMGGINFQIPTISEARRREFQLFPYHSIEIAETIPAKEFEGRTFNSREMLILLRSN